MEMKLVIADPKSGKCYQKVIAEDVARALNGKKIGDSIRGETFDMTGYEFTITGGADYCGFPMRKDIDGPVRKKIMIVSGIGLKKSENGTRHRKTVCGNTIHAKTAQVCLKVTKAGKKPLEEPAAEGEAAPAEAAKEE